MTDKFRAYRIDEQDGNVVAGFQELALEDLTPGNVVIKVSHSTINYKDALAATGSGRILRRYPLNGGIDLAGTVVSSEDAELQAGASVLVNGCGLSETVDGGYSEFARVDSASVVPIPQGMTANEAMQIGTAGYTAALAIHRMEQNGQLPENGPVVVTGATGGVGSIAIDMLGRRGYEVVAVTGKGAEESYLRSIGAQRVLLREQIDLGKRPMEKAEWAGAIDNLGGDYLAWLTRTMAYGGNIASIGLAASHELNTTVLPFILRAVCLLGINSVETPRDLRLAVWSRIGGDLKPQHLDVIGRRTLPFDELPGAFQDYMDGAVTGRTVVEIA
ncbi:MAG: acryloyl-CoA reductase [Gammaproteobacteria bacterium]|nr:acryloyl-CoA reductase [Gammaproteobacteria bacterium]MDH3428879.1 acryloyl-CoA reductase [Gammaproteobacteria bacterium]MDH3432266.1 acryloyl-CoA reductase [Gammaproteobacteria bacterium]